MSVPVDILENQLAELFKEEATGPCDRGDALYAYASGSMAARDRVRFEAHVRQCEECRADWALFEGLEAPHVFTRAKAKPRWAILAAAAAVLVALAAGSLYHAASGNDDRASALLVKGAWRLHVAAHRDSMEFNVESGTELLTGDRLGFFVSGDEPGYVAVFYAAADGIVQLYPAGQQVSAPFDAGDERRLPDGAQLTPGKGCEWIAGVFSEREFATRDGRRLVEVMWKGHSGCEPDPRVGGSHNYDVQIVTVSR